MSEPVDVAHKSHREHKTGRKADKKKLQKEKKSNNVSERPQNPKAFTFNSAIGAERRFRRKQDLQTKKTHIPLVDRTPIEPPPILVAVVGPPKVGKSLLIYCLLKQFTKDVPKDIKGPVTVLSGKKQRITFIECNNDLNSMIDIGKIADLVLLLIDASFGFEMEVFEFLNVCQVHGMPKVMGVLTHLDLIKNSQKLKKTKKILKHRFWTEVYAGAKLFYLSGQMHHEYLRNEIKNLARFISVMKFRQLTWRSSHPYILADRIEDMTSVEMVKKTPKVDRTVCFYGYMRGCPLRKDSSVHIPGVGDLRIKDVSFLPDPCPLPETLKKRALLEKERQIYAPFSGAGGIIYDKDAVYIDLGGSHSHKEEGNELITELIDDVETLEEKLEKSELKLFSESKGIKSKEVEEVFDRNQETVFDNGRMRRRVVFNDKDDGAGQESGGDEDEDEDEDDGEGNQSFEVLDRISEGDEEGEDDDGEDSDEDSENELENESKSKTIGEKEEKDNNDDEDDDDEDDEDEDDENENSNCKYSLKRKIEENNKSSDEKSRGSNKKIKINEDEVEEESEELEAQNCKENNKDNSMNKSVKNNSTSELGKRISETLKSFEKKKLSKLNDDEENFDDMSDNDLDGSVENMDFDEGKRWTRTAEEAHQAFENRRKNIRSLMKLVYDVEQRQTEKKENEEEEEVGGMFRVITEKQKRIIEDRELEDQEDTDFFSQDWPSDEVMEKHSQDERAFLIQGWQESENADELLKLDNLKEDDEEEVFGDFEDLETGQKFAATSESEEPAPKEKSDEDEERKKLLEKKRKLKQQFDAMYDDAETQNHYEALKQEVEKQAQLNRSEFEGLDDHVRVQVEGFRPGMYVRVEIESVSCELIENFDPTFPLILGGLLRGEENIGLVQTKFKKHRWYPKILKTRDPVILSVGWRRFQTIMIYAKLEDNMRQRMLKYTPKHVACMGHFWGPITPQGTGVLAVQDVNNRNQSFRIAATGSVAELDKNTRIVKKLKLIGEPKRIFKNTAFIGGMFNSNLEIAKFQGAKIKTVSGIRGVIKKATKTEGVFRATFEDKIQLSDIVFCRTWVKIEVPHYYNPVINLLLPHGHKNEWRGMRTMAELKKAHNVKAKPEEFKDSLYTPITRTEKVFQPLVIPKNLQKALPYRDKPKLEHLPINHKPQYTERRVAVVRSKEEEKRSELMKRIRTVYNHKLQKEKADMKKRMAEYKKRLEAEEMKQLKKQKELKKQIFRTLSKMDAKDKNKH